MPSLSRRKVLASLAGSAAASVAISSQRGRGAASSFTEVESPTGKGLNDVVYTATGPYAVGDSGRLLQRIPGGWRVVIEDGIRGNGNSILTAASTIRGHRIWMAGSSGVVASYDTLTKTLTDYSKPKGLSSTWTGITVIGTSGAETVTLVNSSGKVLTGELNHCDEATWRTAKKPSGNSIYTVDSGAIHRQFAGGSGTVYENTMKDTAWSQIGISNLGKTLLDLSVHNRQKSSVVGNSGIVADYSNGSWTVTSLSSKAINSVQRAGAAGVAVGNGGQIYTRDSTGWSTGDPLDTSANLEGVAQDTEGEFPDIAVGSVGTIAERGSYDSGTVNRRLRVAGMGANSVSYRIYINGHVSSTATVESSDSVSTTSTGTADHMLEGTVNDSSSHADTYLYSGEITKLEVTSGDPSALKLSVDGHVKDIWNIVDSSWTEVTSPVSNTLYTVSSGPRGTFAAGGSGKLLERTSTGWGTILSTGISGNGNNFHTSTLTSNGRSLWFGGSSGALGEYDLDDETVTDHTAPNNLTGTWKSIETHGVSGSERIYVGSSNGEILIGDRTSSGVTWNDPKIPGSGSTVVGIEFINGDKGYFADTNGDVFETADAGANWTKIGIPNSNTPKSITSGGSQLLVSSGSGTYYRYDGGNWTAISAGSSTNYDIEMMRDRTAIAGGSGTLYEKDMWSLKQSDIPTGASLYGITLSHRESVPAIAVGSSGTILEKSIQPMA